MSAEKIRYKDKIETTITAIEKFGAKIVVRYFEFEQCLDEFGVDAECIIPRLKEELEQISSVVKDEVDDFM